MCLAAEAQLLSTDNQTQNIETNNEHYGVSFESS